MQRSRKLTHTQTHLLLLQSVSWFDFKSLHDHGEQVNEQDYWLQGLKK